MESAILVNHVGDKRTELGLTQQQLAERGAQAPKAHEQKRQEERLTMSKTLQMYLDRVKNSWSVDELHGIVKEAERDIILNDTEFYYFRQKATDRGTRLLFNRA